MPRQPIELRTLFPEDLETTPFRKWWTRCFAVLVVVYAYWSVTSVADAGLEQLFLGGATLFFGAVAWWGLLYLTADPAGTNRREKLRSQPLRSIDCPACETTVDAANMDCPVCGSTLRD
jgi:hypothetical protein